METLGSAIDKLMTVNSKTYYNLKPSEAAKLGNLHVQRICLTEEIDELAYKLLHGRTLYYDAIRPQFKTY